MKKTAFTNGVILDGTKDMKPLTGKMVLVENGKICSIEKQKELGDEWKILDLKGAYLLPGLINLHVHLPGSGKPKEKSSQSPEAVGKLMENSVSRYVIRKMCEGYAKTELMSGVTTIRTVGGLGQIDSNIRNRINQGKMIGPRMYVADMAVSVPGGHMADVLAYSAKSAEECRNYIHKIAEGKPDLIKLMITGGVLDATVKGEPGVLRMPPEYVAACCEEAHKLGLPVAAHVESTQGVEVALEGGVDTIEHGAVLTEELIARFQETGACDICTISPAVPQADLDQKLTHGNDLTQYNGGIVKDGIISAAKTLLQHGILVGLGTDTACPYVTHYDMWRELSYFHKYVGVSNSFAIHTATLVNAQILRAEKEIGSIESGKSADFLIVKDNPLEDLSALRKPYMVVMKGNVIKEPKVKRIQEVDEVLDAM